MRRRGAAIGLLWACALALAACGSSGGVTKAPSVSEAALAHPPVGCTRHLVFASIGPSPSKAVAITFDDGPGPNTEALYRTLLSHRVPATFFMIGERVSALVEEGGKGANLLREMVDHGMEIGNHSYGHPRDLPYEGEGASLQLELANREIERASGFDPCLFRPPYGNLTPELVQRAKALGLTTVKWDDDPEDWRHPGAGVIRDRVLAGVHPGAIIVLHDNVETDRQTVEALPGIIEALEARGYRLTTVTALLGDSYTLHRAPRRRGRLNSPVGAGGE
jgi:peptidoglycan/xylan/chitin deacetylase (PgdA/CDA1 family)